MPKTILVVDDEAEVREYLQLVLTSLGGYEVHLAEDGLAALTLLGEIKPDLILLDMMMPTMDGLSFMIEMDRRNWSIPILVMTAYQAAFETAVRRLSSDCCLMKPFEVDQLLTFVEIMLERGVKRSVVV